MSSKDKLNKGKPKYTRSIFILLLVFALGYYMLNHIATWENPLLGNTFHIVMGCTFMAVSTISIGIIIKKVYFPKNKKRRKKSRHVFLDDSDKNKL